MLILHDPDTLSHETVELLGAKVIPALESPSRILAILEAVSKSQHKLKYIRLHDSNDSTFNSLLELIGQTHNQGYLQHIKTVFKQWRDGGLIEPHEHVLPECFVFTSSAGPPTQPPKDIYARAGYYTFDMSSGIMSKTYLSTMASANLAVEAVRRVMAHSIKEVTALCRPPGHHCNGSKAGGYCYVNNAAVAISEWRRRSPNAKAGILDIDFHHGNGSQDIFYTDPRTFYASIHGADEFPYYTGKEDECGNGDAIGMNFNLPLKTGSSVEQYLEKLELAVTKLSKFDPEFLVVSLGFDTFHLDPLGSFKIYTEDYEVLARTARQRLPNVPTAILLEGGYVVQHLGANLLSFIKGWEAGAANS
jgi:acetoin utilization deacetylase AcuC-like enzyme